jgi:hypothetical protein
MTHAPILNAGQRRSELVEYDRKRLIACTLALWVAWDAVDAVHVEVDAYFLMLVAATSSLAAMQVPT